MPALAGPAKGGQLMRTIPSSGEKIPAVGLGTYRAFSELTDEPTRQRLTRVLQLFYEKGGRVIDSSPMYGPAEATVGELLPSVRADKSDWFLATKVWTDGADAGVRQMRASAEKLGVKTIDLMQIHNLRDWKEHLPTLKRWKEQGKIRYLGITTWGGNDHDELLRLMKSESLDFVQFTYSVAAREAEKRLLPVAQERGIATLTNRNFGQGGLFKEVSGKTLPAWAVQELQIKSWAQFFLKFVLGDPRVTAAIPATSKPEHLLDNMAAGLGPMPDAGQRKKMAALF